MSCFPVQFQVPRILYASSTSVDNSKNVKFRLSVVPQFHLNSQNFIQFSKNCDIILAIQSSFFIALAAPFSIFSRA